MLNLVHRSYGEGVNLVFGTATGTKIGTSTSQKLAFYNSTPIVQPSGNILTALSSLGLIASPVLPLGDANTWTAEQTIQLTTEQFKLAYDASNNATFTVGSNGNLTIAPSGGMLIFTGGFITATTTNASNLGVGSASGTSQNLTISALVFAGASQVSARRTMRGSTNSTITVANSYAGSLFGQEAVTIGASGTHSLFATAVMKPLSITNGAGTLSNSATLYIEDAATGATNNYSLWIGAGTSRFDGNFNFGGTAGSSNGFPISNGTLMGWTQLKTINGSSVIGSGNLTVSASPYTIHSITNASSPYTITETSGEVIILADTSGGAITVNVPTAVGNTAKYFVKLVVGGNTLTIDPSGSQTIDGSPTATMTVANTTLAFISDNSNLYII